MNKAEVKDAIRRLCQPRRYDGHEWLCCFNVKAHDVDLSFENLLKVAKERIGVDDLFDDDPVWMSNAKAEFQKVEHLLWDFGVDTAQDVFVGGPCDDSEPWYAQRRPGDDEFVFDRRGNPLNTRFIFAGRSGGWLVLTQLYDRTLENRHHTYQPFAGWNVAELRRLLSFAKTLYKLTSRPGRAVEDGAAYWLFADVCSGVETTEDLHARWALDQSGEH